MRITMSTLSAATFRLSQTIKSTPSPPIPQAYKWASSYVPRPGRPLLDMSQGVPGTPPPAVLLNALGTTASDPKSCAYGHVAGEPLLKTALIQEMKAIYGQDSDLDAEDVALTAGCNMAFTVAIMALASSGDEVILPVPWYFNHEMTLRMLGITPVPLHTNSKSGFQPSLEECTKLITAKTKAVVLVSPNNPTGAVYSPSLIAKFAVLARKHNIALIMDETYRDYIIDDVPHHLFSPGVQKSSTILPRDWDWRRHFIHLFSFSKSYCIPGHRLGAIVAPHTVLEQVKTVLDCLQICAPRHVQLALHPLLHELRPFIKDTAIALAHRHQLFRRLLPETWHIGSQGGYYAFVKHPFKDVPSMEVSRRMASECGVVTLPVQFFLPIAADDEEIAEANDGWIRFSVASVDEEKIKQVCERLQMIEKELIWPTG